MVADAVWDLSVTAFLPSTTAMRTTLLAYAYYLEPTSSATNRRVYVAAFFFALGAIFAWPFSLLLSLPFVFEELFVGGKDIVLKADVASWRTKRVVRFAGAAAVAGLIAVSPPRLLKAFRLFTDDRSRRSPSSPSTRTPTVASRSRLSTSSATTFSALDRTCTERSPSHSTSPTSSSTSISCCPSPSSRSLLSPSRTSSTSSGSDPSSDCPSRERRARTRSLRSGLAASTSGLES